MEMARDALDTRERQGRKIRAVSVGCVVPFPEDAVVKLYRDTVFFGTVVGLFLVAAVLFGLPLSKKAAELNERAVACHAAGGRVVNDSTGMGRRSSTPSCG
jgi:pyruvate/2-oxoacid:ferredoxin oxidoreductase alpha subunit